MGHVTKPTPAKCSQGALSPKDCKAVASHVLGKTTGIKTGDLSGFARAALQQKFSNAHMEGWTWIA